MWCVWFVADVLNGPPGVLNAAAVDWVGVVATGVVFLTDSDMALSLLVAPSLTHRSKRMSRLPLLRW
jgi:hypothetical protein